MTVAPSATSAQTLSSNDPASVIAFLLLMKVGAVLLYGKQARRGNHSSEILSNRQMPDGHRDFGNKDTMKRFPRILLATAVFAGMSGAPSRAAEIIRLAVQKTGTCAWELAVIRAHGLDRQADLAIQVNELASPEAGKIALRGGAADIIVSDWLWVSRERGLGAKLTFYPYSRALGAVMVPNISSIRQLTELKSRKLAVAGGPIDKNWLLLRASMKQDGIDLKSESTIVYGAPPLLAAKMLSGEMDAT